MPGVQHGLHRLWLHEKKDGHGPHCAAGHRHGRRGRVESGPGWPEDAVDRRRKRHARHQRMAYRRLRLRHCRGRCNCSRYRHTASVHTRFAARHGRRCRGLGRIPQAGGQLPLAMTRLRRCRVRNPCCGLRSPLACVRRHCCGQGGGQCDNARCSRHSVMHGVWHGRRHPGQQQGCHACQHADPYFLPPCHAFIVGWQALLVSPLPCSLRHAGSRAGIRLYNENNYH